MIKALVSFLDGLHEISNDRILFLKNQPSLLNGSGTLEELTGLARKGRMLLDQSLNVRVRRRHGRHTEVVSTLMFRAEGLAAR